MMIDAFNIVTEVLSLLLICMAISLSCELCSYWFCGVDADEGLEKRNARLLNDSLSGGVRLFLIVGSIKIFCEVMNKSYPGITLLDLATKPLFWILIVAIFISYIICKQIKSGFTKVAQVIAKNNHCHECEKEDNTDLSDNEGIK